MKRGIKRKQKNLIKNRISHKVCKEIGGKNTGKKSKGEIKEMSKRNAQTK